MSYEVTLTPEAKHDLREIYRYIAVELQSLGGEHPQAG